MERLNHNLRKHIEELILRYPKLDSIAGQIIDAYLIMENCYDNGRKLLIAGNGGSAADAEHIVGELMKGFKLPRSVSDEFANKLMSISPKLGIDIALQLQGALPAISLTTHEAMTTAYLNDADSSCVFAQKLYGYGAAGDVFLGISTSGNSENIIKAAITAKAKGIKVIGLTGNGGGKLENYADVMVKAPSTETYMVQELHLPIYHCWCLMLEERFFGSNEEK